MKILFIGDGQLGQMLGASGISHGHECLLFSTRSNTVKPLSAQLDLSMSLAEAIAWADVVSWEHEDIPADIIAAAHDKFLMDPARIKSLTDRRAEKKLFDDCQVPTSPWQTYHNADELTKILQQAEQPLVLKAARGGYDGKGQWRFGVADEVAEVAAAAGQAPGIAEQMIAFEREVSLVGARSKDGSICCYPLITNVHERGILSYSLGAIDPVSDALQQQAEACFKRLTDALNYVGVLAIEFFVVEEQQQTKLLVNEIAPRVHNSGHWTMTGANSSQFDLHIRALTGMPLPLLRLTPTLMLNVIGAEQIPAGLWHHADTDCHWYNKEARPGRKVGHVNIRTANRDTAQQWVSQWAHKLQVLAD
ncbi:MULTISPECIES: 5-(carboxyamino)imidazole ribonucleotide synthase [Idiomarinaceae]|uniref:N5-carboxyaminoimidazole ribonucleotide synthase n=4 Tax=Pseudidiomarina TaxID=2800384 RepID=A0A368UWY0_9GAMM|nr:MULTISPECIES: 5-(carboxyamino)imidazole ribonucleotide synthase [Idiomarinaceae]MDT7525673.1 5-(carboxyamino)imidazole ribonucleotide synthase [Pseudidiomarina sp. GXY010]MDX1526044.1 5-(carboxyamino)imidazole ribonucleotide synthase [Pseudidiomarina maritima]MRJ42176.1 5-(carboxyamino)imidazole ribonucleotide synthase [Idiomarina sp. FeN1]NCU57102.1 5-(carboxyamino)imidazole ribonucleotide synthase [Idiomarina sp. FenA--70]NCU59811.1 5-(carboxyamino)imidazole ribonucleotide synthase [Idiom